MNNLVKINNKNLQVKEFKGQRIVTFKDIDFLHERTEGTAKRNFSENKKHFVDGIDYFIVKPSDIEKYEIRTLEIPNRGLTLLTESGYLMLTKSLTDDLAWDVQRELVNKYFRTTGGYQVQQNTIAVLNKTTQDLQGTITEYKKMCKITCSKKQQYIRYIKNRLGIDKANKEFEQVKARLFLVLGVEKWEDIDFETANNLIQIIDESIRVIKAERPYKQLSYFEC